MNIGPTFVHKNHGHESHKRTLGPGETEFPAGARASDMSPSYNKPGSIMHWVNEAEEARDPRHPASPVPVPQAGAEVPELSERRGSCCDGPHGH